MAKFREGDIIDVPMRVVIVGPYAYKLEALDNEPRTIGIFMSFIDGHARLHEKAQPEPSPAEIPIAVGDVVRLRSGSPPFVVSALHEQGHATLLTWASSVTDFAEHVVPIACLKKDSD